MKRRMKWKMAGGGGQVIELPDQVTETGGWNLGQSLLPEPSRPPEKGNSCHWEKIRNNTLTFP